MSLQSLLGLGATGLQASTAGAQVASNSVANAATEGATRRRVEMVAITPGAPNGGGVRMRSSTRIVDPFIERRLLDARSASSEAQTRAQALAPIDAVFSENEGNVGAALDQFESSFALLAARPGDPAVRAQVLAGADGLARAMNSAATRLDDARVDANDRIVGQVQQINERLDKIGKLGVEISRSEMSGQEASDLRDQRDVLLRELADRVPIKTIEQKDGNMTVLIAGTDAGITIDGRAIPLGFSRDANNNIRVTVKAAGAEVDVTTRVPSGMLGGLIAARDGAIATARTSLDQLASDVANAYDAKHLAGFGLDGAGGRHLFTPLAGVPGAAAALQVSSDVAGQPDKLAASASATAVPGDNLNALAMADLSRSKYALGGTKTAQQSLAATLATGGTAIASARADAQLTGDVAAGLESLRTQVSGISSDDEMVRLTTMQRSYQASLRVIEAADQMLQELLSLKR